MLIATCLIQRRRVDFLDGNSVSFGTSTLSPIAYDVRGARSNYALTPGQSVSFGSDGNAATGPILDMSAADLAAFTGTGTYTPLFTTLSGLAINNSGGNVTAVQTTTATGTLTISYNFTAAPPPTTVPEPASMLLLGAGLVGMGVIRRRR